MICLEWQPLMLLPTGAAGSKEWQVRAQGIGSAVLRLQSLEEKDAGRHACLASNGSGPELRKEFVVSVSGQSELQAVAQAGRGQLDCLIDDQWRSR